MRNVQRIWDVWRSGLYLGDNRPSTRVTVEESYWLRATGPVLGQWSRGPARWFQRADVADQIETEIPGVLSVESNRSNEPDAGTCDITIANVTPAQLGAVEIPTGQFDSPGYYTPERGDTIDAQGRWGHTANPWHNVLAPNALIRTYQGFGGHDKPIRQAEADGDIVLNGVWLVDDVTIGTEGTMSIKCRDMCKLLIDQQLVPPLVPTELYPLLYRRYRTEPFKIPADPPPATDAVCMETVYPPWPGLYSSTDEYFGFWNAAHTGHPPVDAFDISAETGGPESGWEALKLYRAHQASYWLSEPKAASTDTVWIEMDVHGNLPVNEIYYHAWKGAIEGAPLPYVMVSIWESGAWAAPETYEGGITPQGIPYVSTFTPGADRYPGELTNKYRLPRDYRTTRIRLTVGNLIPADDFPEEFRDPDFHGGGYRQGARKLMACNNPKMTLYPALVVAGVAIPVNKSDRLGYWQVRTTGLVVAFGDARLQPVNSPGQHQWPVSGMAVHPSGNGYWTVDHSGFVLSYGAATHHGDPSAAHRSDFLDIAPTPSGNGYWILRTDGTVTAYGDAYDMGSRGHSATLPSGVPAWAQAIESHPTTQGYWVLWSDGFVDNFGLADYGDANRGGFLPLEWVTTIKRTSTGKGYRVLSGAGIVQCFGDAKSYGNAPPNTSSGTGRWPYELFFDLLLNSSGDDGYAVQKTNGSLYGRGTFKEFGSIGAGSGTLRYEGNYKDYSDIIRDLLLWAGFYFYEEPAPSGQMPSVYGNVETTGAYSTNDPLPQEMFDKRPVLDAIRDIKAIVGYSFFIDAEGGARWEAPNWWAMGNYLSNVSGTQRTPFAYMPEIDEAVQLTSHSVVRSAAAARSEIIIATEYPYATVNGQKVADGIVKTQIVGSTAGDLKGIISPAIWHNGEFLKKEEQQTMAEILDMQIWFRRRTASIQCVANPLIDVNDQVRVIERVTGDVFVHYIKSISFSHDVQSGQFTMSLTTHWLGGTPYGKGRRFYACAARPQGDGFWQIDNEGVITAYGAAQLYQSHEADTHTIAPIAMRSTPSGYGYWTLDQYGKLLSYGDAVNHGGLTRGRLKDVIDMAITPSGNGYWILVLTGQVFAFGDAAVLGNATVTGTVKARSIEAHPTAMGYWTLLSDGTVGGHGIASLGNANRTNFKPTEYVTRLRATSDGGGYWIVSTLGKIQTKGNAPYHGGGIGPLDEFAEIQAVSDLMTSPNNGYAIQRATGALEFFEFPEQGVARPGLYEPSWALVSADTHRDLVDSNSAYPVSPRLTEFLKHTGSPSANNAATNNFNSPPPTALEGTVV